MTDQNLRERVEGCRENLAKFEGKWRLCDVITGYESVLYLRQIGHKASNASWVAKGEYPRTIVKRDRFEPKNTYSILFKTTGMVHIDCLKRAHLSLQITILKFPEKEINKQRPTSGTTRPNVTKAVKTHLNK